MNKNYATVTNKEIKEVLKSFGMFTGRLNNSYTNNFKKSIKYFQRVNGLVPDGIVGPLTLAELFPEPFGDRESDKVIMDSGKYPHQKDVPAFYGEAGTSQVKIRLPYKMKIAWKLSQSIDKFYCHKKISEPLQSIFEDTYKTYGQREISRLGLDIFGGCYHLRKMRGGSGRLSMHSWGIAVDLDPSMNLLRWTKEEAQFAKPIYNDFWEIVEKHGAISLGRERDFDWMHFQFARL